MSQTLEQPMQHYIGLDVSMKRTFICVLNEQGKIVHEGSESTDPHLIADYLSKLSLKEMTVGFESGSLTPYLLTGFKERAIDAICMDARKLSPILALKVNKTDNYQHQEDEADQYDGCWSHSVINLRNSAPSIPEISPRHPTPLQS